MKSRRVLTVLAVLLAMTFTFFAGVTYARQWRMYDARTALQNARNLLQAAEPDKGGHRIQAITLVNQALEQVNLGIRAGHR